MPILVGTASDVVDPEQLRLQVVRPALELIELWSSRAEALVLGTAAQESHLRYLSQLGAGPALGLWQMEPDTHTDIWDNYLRYRPELAERAMLAGGHQATTKHERPPHNWLIYNLRYAAAMCRIHYRRVPAALPNADDLQAMGKYYKQFYNTAEGAATVGEFVRSYGLLDH